MRGREKPESRGERNNVRTSEREMLCFTPVRRAPSLVDAANPSEDQGVRDYEKRRLSESESERRKEDECKWEITKRQHGQTTRVPTPHASLPVVRPGSQWLETGTRHVSKTRRRREREERKTLAISLGFAVVRVCVLASSRL